MNTPCMSCGVDREGTPAIGCLHPSNHYTPEKHQVWVWIWDEVHPFPGELNPDGKTIDEVSDSGRWEIRGTGVIL